MAKHRRQQEEAAARAAAEGGGEDQEDGAESTSKSAKDGDYAWMKKHRGSKGWNESEEKQPKAEQPKGKKQLQGEPAWMAKHRLWQEAREDDGNMEQVTKGTKSQSPPREYQDWNVEDAAWLKAHRGAHPLAEKTTHAVDHQEPVPQPMPVREPEPEPEPAPEPQLEPPPQESYTSPGGGTYFITSPSGMFQLEVPLDREDGLPPCRWSQVLHSSSPASPTSSGRARSGSSLSPR